MSSFRKRNVQKPVPGTRTSPHTGQVITSSGNPSLDVILGGGLPIGAICLIEEDKYITHAKVLAKYFLAEGITSTQDVFLASLDDEPADMLRKLPQPLTDEEIEQEQKNEVNNTNAEDGLRIAWRYNDLPLVNSEQTGAKIGHHFNLMEQMDPVLLFYSRITLWNDVTDARDIVVEDEDIVQDHFANGQQDTSTSTTTSSESSSIISDKDAENSSSSSGTDNNKQTEAVVVTANLDIDEDNDAGGGGGGGGAGGAPTAMNVEEAIDQGTTNNTTDNSTTSTVTATVTETAANIANIASATENENIADNDNLNNLNINNNAGSNNNNNINNNINVNIVATTSTSSPSSTTSTAIHALAPPSLGSIGQNSFADKSQSQHHPQSQIFANGRYERLMKELQKQLQDERYTPGANARKELCRVCLTSLGSPLWYDEHFPQDILKFLTFLRAAVRSATAVCFITMPMHLIAKRDPSLVPKIRNLVDYAIELDSFAGSARETHPAFKDYSGLLHLRKITAINTLTAYMPETTDLAFKLRRKKFVIEKLHLPPELQDAKDSEHNGGGSSSGGGAGMLSCASNINSKLDF